MVKLRSAAEEVLSRHDHFEFQISGSPTDLLVEAHDGEFFVAHFRLSTMPANPFYVVGWGVKVDEDYRGRGIGQEMLDLRIEIIRQSGAHTYINTVNKENEPQNHIMQKYEFERIQEGDNTFLWARKVTETEEVPA